MSPAPRRRRASQNGAARGFGTPSWFARARAFSATALVTSLLAAAPTQATPGDLDPTFSGDGKQLTNIGVSSYGNGVAIQSDGKILAVGGGAGGFALARCKPDGSLDTSFDGDGKLTTGVGTAYDVALFGGAASPSWRPVDGTRRGEPPEE